MGRKKITNLFPDYIRTGNADLEALSQLVLSAKGERSMNDFANECGVNTSTIGTLIKVCKELPDVQFIFAGTGPLEETVNGIKNIKNVGFQKGEALEKLIREARFSIYPSEWYENCPFSVMESQMYGTPVLGANIGGIPELIQVGKTGELFESGNAEDLKKKIEKLWGDKKLCAEYSANCKDISFDGQFGESEAGCYE